MNQTDTYTSLSTELRTVPGADLVTSGGLQVVVTCPNCGAQHRHLGLGLRRSPCGTWYAVTRTAGLRSEA
ncbi:hypothetical protein [Actinacidiphila oryziradicis]|uniref:Uncharacterized protein n=1 Tax=Actinacidiphila oryziradicis TaxID=2571141 RepID=A0A4U0SR43_9ACTN|nr:hypothetical protein [Actinacidiphila oryziradicis]TKA11743.1 hypothetical protein FCI23_10460 [Actinacidiphila oryziradicis]